MNEAYKLLWFHDCAVKQMEWLKANGGSYEMVESFKEFVSSYATKIKEIKDAVNQEQIRQSVQGKPENGTESRQAKGSSPSNCVL